MGTHAVFRALADPTRHDILRLLRIGPRTSGGIALGCDASRATNSHHLALLHDTELLVAEREGQRIHDEFNTTVSRGVVDHLLELVQSRRPNA